MQRSPDTSAHSEAVRMWRAEGDFTKSKGDPWYRTSPSLFVHSLLYPTVSARLEAGQEHCIAGLAQEGGISCSSMGCGSWTWMHQRGDEGATASQWRCSLQTDTSEWALSSSPGQQQVTHQTWWLCPDTWNSPQRVSTELTQTWIKVRDPLHPS